MTGVALVYAFIGGLGFGVLLVAVWVVVGGSAATSDDKLPRTAPQGTGTDDSSAHAGWDLAEDAPAAARVLVEASEDSEQSRLAGAE